MPDTLQYRDAIRYHRMETTGTGIQRAGIARLIRITVNDPTAAAVLNVWESPTTAGEKVAIIDCSNPGTFEYGVTLSGLTVDLSGANADVTVVYQ